MCLPIKSTHPLLMEALISICVLFPFFWKALAACIEHKAAAAYDPFLEHLSAGMRYWGPGVLFSHRVIKEEVFFTCQDMLVELSEEQ
jgi:hypothetical protein